MSNRNNFNTGEPLTKEEVLSSITEVRIQLEEYMTNAENSAQKAFKESFNADYKRGDIIVFPHSRKATYDLLMSMAPELIRCRFKLDRTNSIKDIFILNGEYVIPKGWQRQVGFEDE